MDQAAEIRTSPAIDKGSDVASMNVVSRPGDARVLSRNMVHRALCVLAGVCGLGWACAHAADNEDWRRYPFRPQGTQIEFPKDEGTHKADTSVTMEWWYVTFHLTDPSSKKQYSVMAAFFKEAFGRSLRLFDISSLSDARMYAATTAGALDAKPGQLDITHRNRHGSDRLFVRKSPDGVLLPFRYHLEVNGPNTTASLNMELIKPPMIVGGDGYVQVGNAGHSWYYSFTRMQAEGEIEIKGKRMTVTGVAWMDHQWGPFMISPIPIIQTDTYEWFSIQLDNGEDYMVSNIFDRRNRLQRHKGFGGLGWMGADSSTGETTEFTLRRLAFWQAPCGDTYSGKWQIIEPGRDLDLVITPDFQNQVVPLPRTPFGQFYFWEGSCSVAGKVQGKEVKGRAFGELTHRYKVPVVSFTSPLPGKTLSGKVEVAWTVANPDQGNPLVFKLLCRSGNADPVELADGVSVTTYAWDTAGLPDGDTYVLEVVATSCDGTLSGNRLSGPFAIRNHGAPIRHDRDPTQAAPETRPLSYPYSEGQLSFPKDEGRHSPSEHPFTIMEWFAHYAHLTSADGTRYFLFTTFVTYDPIEKLLRGKFPHMIATLVDVTNGKTYHCRDNSKLARFAEGHADAATAKGDYFRWKGQGRPFQYELQVTVRDPRAECSVDLELEMVKPPLVVNGTGYIREPEGLSGYYSQTRLKATGHVTVGGVKKTVQGIHWVDRQWLGASFAQNDHYSYEWWALQLDNNEEAIMFRIWDTDDDTIAMSVLEINHADGRREKVEDFTLTDQGASWHVSAPRPGWDLKISPACEGQGTWQSCDVTGTIAGKPVTGLAAAELARNIAKELAPLLRPNRKRSK